jgi:hypothetical protein
MLRVDGTTVTTALSTQPTIQQEPRSGTVKLTRFLPWGSRDGCAGLWGRKDGCSVST